MKKFNYKIIITSINFEKNFNSSLKEIINLLNEKLNKLKKNNIIKNFNIKTEHFLKKKYNKIVVNRSPHVNNKSKETFIEEKLKTKINIYNESLCKTKVSNEIFSILYKKKTDLKIKWEETCL